ncbi:hypothetical protein DSO57_1012466 [Entomophthora muscae]|uniref:Uncharacterized protein n=1 Tax=Entomophthora muscae TaxID=34485 RepID=A0ACC2RWY0_9FUNG|nr:hypothetical protein DSO57_1012466 [Entomophthora muscae]
MNYSATTVKACAFIATSPDTSPRLAPRKYKFIQVKIRTSTTSRTVGAFIDTRAEESFINATLAKDLGLEATSKSVKVIMGNSSHNLGFRCCGETLHQSVAGIPIVIESFLTESDPDFLLYGVIILSKPQA